MQEETAKVEEHLLDGAFARGVIRCFTTSKANAFENLLEPLQKLLRLSPPIALSLANPDLFCRILQKLQSSKAVVRLNLLRIVRSICDASEEQGALIGRYGLVDTIQRLAEVDGAVLVRNMASELVRSSEANDRLGASGSKRRLGRRTSSSNTPPSLLTSHSMPHTPTSSRSSHSTNYHLERTSRHTGAVNSPVAYRPASRDGNNSSGLANSINTSGIIGKSRLPRTSVTRQPTLTLPKKNENMMLNTYSRDITSSPAPNSRQRRRMSGETR